MRNFLRKFIYAGQGLVLALRSELNMKIHAACAFAVIGLGLYQRLQPWEWGLLFLAIGLVIVCEMINTALEMTINIICKEYYPLAKNVKDVAAGAVLLSAGVAVLVGVVIFFG